MINLKRDIDKAFNLETSAMKNMKSIPLFAAMLFAGVAQATPTGIVNLVTKHSGVHKISYEQLASQGVNLAGVSVDKLALTRADKSIYRYISDVNGDGFGTGDSIEFIAADSYTRYSDESVFTLHIDESLAKDISLEESEVSYDGVSSATAGYAFYKKQDRNVYWGTTNPNKRDPFIMGSLLATTSPATNTYALDLESPNLQGGDVTLGAVVSGGFKDVHQVVVSLNGVEVAEAEFTGFKRRTITGKVPASALKASGNKVSITLPVEHDAPVDQIAIESISVKYPMSTTTADDTLVFKAVQGTNVATGFSSDSVSVYQVVGKIISKIDTAAVQASTGYGVAFASKANASTYIAGEKGYLTPEVSQVVDIDESINAGEAEYLVISHADFIGAELQELVNLRAGSYSTKVVDVAQIYTQYGVGVASAQSIRDYIKYAYTNLGTKMVVLVGGDTSDYQQYVSSSISFIPTVYTTIKALHTVNHSPSDAAYGDIDKDGVPDIAVGRLPVRTNGELANIVAKINAYEQRTYNDIIFATDAIDAAANYNFDTAAQKVISDLASDDLTYISVEELGLEGAKQSLVDEINEGAALTSWFGHSNLNQWSSGGFLTTVDISNLNNAGKPTVMTQFGCWNAYFVTPSGNSMAHVALLNGENGAATVLGSATLSLAPTEVALAEKFFAAAVSKGQTVGDALIEAKQKLSLSGKGIDVLLGWQIIGDPALKVVASTGGR